MRRIFPLWLVCVALGGPALAEETPTVPSLIAEAEKWFWAFEDPDRAERARQAVDRLEWTKPGEPYVHWARARLAYWKKEGYYVLEAATPGKEYLEEKLAAAKECHAHADRCISVAPRNAECHMVKGGCYSMEASTWGQTLKTLGVLKPMDREWEKAMELPSNFKHLGVLPTRQLAGIMRGILHRMVPDSFWLDFLAGMRGNKQRAYKWVREGVTGPLLEEPVTVVELGATAICFGRDSGEADAVEYGMRVLRDGQMLPIRYPLDALDEAMMKLIVEHPEKACSYRREKIEDISVETIRRTLRQSQSNKPR